MKKGIKLFLHLLVCAGGTALILKKLVSVFENAAPFSPNANPIMFSILFGFVAMFGILFTIAPFIKETKKQKPKTMATPKW
jgi:predicted PurR-regulated permease PerM